MGAILARGSASVRGPMTTENAGDSNPSSEERVRKVYVKDLHEKERVRTVFRVMRKAKVTARSGKAFLALTFADRTGVVEGRVFERVEELEPAFLADDYVLVTGHVTTFHGKPQVVAENLERLDPGPIDAAEFTPPPEALEAVPEAREERREAREEKREAREEKREAREERREAREERPEGAVAEEGRRSFVALREMAERVGDAHVRAVLVAFLDDPGISEPLRTAPAGRTGPRAYRGGLADHLASVMRLALRMGEHYAAADRDLLVAGALLQGIMRAQELGPEKGPLTDEARLVGAQVMAAQKLREKARALSEFPPLLEQHLVHIVLAVEDPRLPGAARPALTLEAELVRSLVAMDTRLTGWMEAMARDPHDTWTEPLKVDGRTLWKGVLPTQRGRSPVETRRKKKAKGEKPERAERPERPVQARKEREAAGAAPEKREEGAARPPREQRPPRELPSELTFKPFSALTEALKPEESEDKGEG